MPDLPRVGEEFGNYRLGQRLGRGGMSVVFQAENWRLGNVVALKILAPDLANDDNFRARFLQESRIAAGFNHPHVVPIIDSGAYDGLLYIAMRYVAGTDLRKMIGEQHRLDPGSAVHLLSQAALALDAAHRHGLVHRDVKPANLLVERTSDDLDPDHLYLADFGITKYVGGPSRFSGLTTAGTIMGTALYLAPEQAQELAVGGAADQYALGCVLYECLTGRAPFEKGSGQAIMIAHVEEPPPPATMFRPGLPPDIDAVFARVLAKHPGQRYPTCRAFMAAASDALGMPGRLPGSARSPEFRPAPLPSDELPWAVRRSGAMHYLATQDLPGADPLPEPWQAPGEDHRYGGEDDAGGERPGGGEWSFLSADEGGGDGRPARGRRVRRYRQSRALVITVSLAVLAAVGTGCWLLAAQPFKAKAPVTLHSSAAAAARPASQLYSVLEKTAGFLPGDLKMSSCVQQGTTIVNCTNPSPAIKSVSFVTLPSLGKLYSRYVQTVEGRINGVPFTTVENKGVCSGTAPEQTAENPEATDENTWNHSGGTSDSYSVAQLASGTVPVDLAAGRVFCEQTASGSAIIIWTEDYGKLLVYATGGAASHEEVWEWWDAIHHQIIFPGDTGMSMTMSPATSMSPAATANDPGASSGPPSATAAASGSAPS